MGTYRSYIRLFIFLIVFIFPGSPARGSLEKLIPPEHVQQLQSLAALLNRDFHACANILARLQRDRGAAATGDIAHMRRLAAGMRQKKAALDAAFDAIGNDLTSANAPDLFLERLRGIQSRLAARLDHTLTRLARDNPEQLASDGLLFKREKAPQKKTREGLKLRKENITEISKPKTSLLQEQIPAIPPESLEGFDMPRQEKKFSVSASGNAFVPPGEADLREDGVDVVFTDAIRQIAESLQHDPVKIYDYVKNNFTYQPYWGSLKGARGALAERSGNDADLASLLIALLRCSGYPARYAEAPMTIDIERAKNWLGMDEDRQVGYFLATADIPDAEVLYRGAKIEKVRFRHVFVEVYLPYGDYRGQQNSDLHKLWVPLAPAFKPMRHVAGLDVEPAVPFDAEQFTRELAAGTTVNADGSISAMDSGLISSQMETYSDSLEDFITGHNPLMSFNELYGCSRIEEKHDPILSITLPFESAPAVRYSALQNLARHHVKIQLSYWGTDLDADEEEGGLGTQEIRYMAPTASVVGRRLTLSYRPATPEDEALLRQYDGNIFGTPCFLIHMYPRLTLDGAVVAENTDSSPGQGIDNAAISLGLDENIRIELYKPGEIVFPQRRSDTIVTVGDYMGIVLDCGSIAKEYLDESSRRLAAAIDDTSADVERVLGEQLFMTGAAYFYQFDAQAEAMAQQAGVRWFRNPSELTISRHLQVSWLMDCFPVAIESTTILLDVTGNRIQAIPRTYEWDRREAFLRTAMQYMSLMEHTVLTELYHQNAVSAVKLMKTASDTGTAVYEITPENKAEVLGLLELPREDIDIVERELQLGQTVLVPKTKLTVGSYTGAPIVSLTPRGNPMGAFREGYFITRCRPDPYPVNPSNGGQITEAITDILNDFVAPDYQDWISFKETSEGALQAIITNSDSIRDGSIQARSLLSSVSGMAMSLYLSRAQAAASSMMSIGSLGSMNLSMQSMGEFLGNTLVMYIDFEGNPYYFPEKNNGVRTAKYVVMDILGQAKAGLTVQGTVTHITAKALDEVTPVNAQGIGTFTFSYDNTTELNPGDPLRVNLELAAPDGQAVKTEGTFRVNGLDLDIDSNNSDGFNTPERSRDEELAEDLAAGTDHPGKIIQINNGDADNDNVPNFADGINMFANDGPDAGGRFVPLVIEIGGAYDPANIEIKFSYTEADPRTITRTGEGTDENPYGYEAPSGKLRLWKADGNVSRSIAEANVSSGHYIKSGAVYTGTDLGSGNIITLFIEGIHQSDSPGDEKILVEAREKGSASGWNMRDELRVTLLDIGIDPDYNRDGVIDEQDRGKVSEKKPWRFWVNDDDDGDSDKTRGLNDDLNDFYGLGVPDDLPGQKEDNRDAHVNGIRDLVDFMALRFRLENALAFFPPEQFMYQISHESEALGMIKEYIVAAGSAGLYLTDPDEAIKLYESEVVPINSRSEEPYFFPEAMLAAMLGDNRTDTLVFEARGRTEKPLVLEIIRKDSGKSVFNCELPLEILDVQELYLHANFRNVGCPSEEDCGGAFERLDTEKKPFCMTDNDKALVWVHGYNVNGKAAAATYSEIFKRLFHTGFNGNFYGVSWYGDPPATGAPHYHQAVVNAFNLSEPFADFINTIVKAENAKVSVAAHSLGNLVVGASMQDYGLTLDNYFAVDAAVALEAYGQNYDDNQSMIKVKSWKSYYDYDCQHDNATGQKKLMASEWHTLFEGTDDNRKQLTWRNRLKDNIGPSMFNFYSSTEEVLATYSGDSMIFDGTWSNFSDKAWVKQEKFKGRINDLTINAGGVGSPYAGWEFNLFEPAYTKKQTVTTPAGTMVEVDVPKSPAEIGELNEDFIEELKTKPFFRPFPPEILDNATGSGFVVKKVGETSLKDYYTGVDAGSVPVRDWLLAEAFPATSLPMGANENAKLLRKNYNLSTSGLEGFMTEKENTTCPWPRKIKVNDIYVNQWFHSDYKDLSYQHVNNFYKKIVEMAR